MSIIDTEHSVNTADCQELSAVVIPLLKGVIYEETHPALWSALLNQQSRIREYVLVIGLELVLDESEGYAFLQSKHRESDEEEKQPRLIVRRPLSFHQSLLLALLRKKLVEFDAHGGETRLILSRNEVLELFRIFLPEGTNEARLTDLVESLLNKIADLGFIRLLPGREKSYEVRRILKAYVDAQWLADFDQRLAEYRHYWSEKHGDKLDE